MSKLVLTLEYDGEEDTLLHPRIAGALRDYAEAVIYNNRRIMLWKSKDPCTGLIGEPPVGLTTEGKLTTAHGITISEARGQ